MILDSTQKADEAITSTRAANKQVHQVGPE